MSTLQLPAEHTYDFVLSIPVIPHVPNIFNQITNNNLANYCFSVNSH